MTSIRLAGRDDLTTLKSLVEGAYRGDSARRGWNHEADILDDERIEAAEIERLLADENVTVLVAEDRGGAAVGCVAVTRKDNRRAYLGMLCVDPLQQSGGLGRALLDAAEMRARNSGLALMEMTVIMCRDSLIAWYERCGYTRTGETRPFPAERTPQIHFIVLEKALDSA